MIKIDRDRNGDGCPCVGLINALILSIPIWGVIIWVVLGVK